MESKSSAGSTLAADLDKNEASEPVDGDYNKKEGKSCSMDDDIKSEKDVKGCSTATGLSSRELTDWEVRRCGAMAARLLRDVRIN